MRCALGFVDRCGRCPTKPSCCRLHSPQKFTHFCGCFDEHLPCGQSLHPLVVPTKQKRHPFGSVAPHRYLQNRRAEWMLFVSVVGGCSEQQRRRHRLRDTAVPKACRGFRPASTNHLRWFASERCAFLPNKNTTLLGGIFIWWERVDSNHRSRRQQIYSLPHLAALEHSRIGAGERSRTINLLITNQLLCH